VAGVAGLQRESICYKVKRAWQLGALRRAAADHLEIRQETLAEIIGTTRPRVSHFISKFRKLGFIDYNGHLQVHSSLLSVVLHDDA
jgi:hypothetical protein